MMERNRANPEGAQAQTKRRHGKASWGKHRTSEAMAGRARAAQGPTPPRGGLSPALLEEREQAAAGGSWGETCAACEGEQVKVLNVREVAVC